MRNRVFAGFAALAVCCAVLTAIGCRRAAEPPAETAGAPSREEPMSTVEVDSEYFIAYPGATVDTESFERDPSRLLQRIDAKPAEVIEYYQHYYRDKGWTDGPKLDQDTFTSRAFVGERGWVTLTIQAPEAGSRMVSLIYTERP